MIFKKKHIYDENTSSSCVLLFFITMIELSFQSFCDWVDVSVIILLFSLLFSVIYRDHQEPLENQVLQDLLGGG